MYQTIFNLVKFWKKYFTIIFVLFKIVIMHSKTVSKNMVQKTDCLMLKIIFCNLDMFEWENHKK